MIHEYLFISLFRACAESLASENASRLAAMGRAERNIGAAATLVGNPQDMLIGQVADVTQPPDAYVLAPSGLLGWVLLRA